MIRSLRDPFDLNSGPGMRDPYSQTRSPDNSQYPAARPLQCKDLSHRCSMATTQSEWSFMLGPGSVPGPTSSISTVRGENSYVYVHQNETPHSSHPLTSSYAQDEWRPSGYFDQPLTCQGAQTPSTNLTNPYQSHQQYASNLQGPLTDSHAQTWYSTSTSSSIPPVRSYSTDSNSNLQYDSATSYTTSHDSRTGDSLPVRRFPPRLLRLFFHRSKHPDHSGPTRPNLHVSLLPPPYPHNLKTQVQIKLGILLINFPLEPLRPSKAQTWPTPHHPHLLVRGLENKPQQLLQIHPSPTQPSGAQIPRRPQRGARAAATGFADATDVFVAAVAHRQDGAEYGDGGGDGGREDGTWRRRGRWHETE
ncbi:hypothetical protein K402DRAFT_126996 [Aulographum hederae CBS 113979]|uniref:Uncharacterized protein n=1 Tax=Aulographum hederae CBS 113979 TaxID=1176131 RepID=A0A6G1HE51_9PEZI|nr:hypothetical protein K402DRAFT_126996 [Aulographum hederae CBS 113979]